MDSAAYQAVLLDFGHCLLAGLAGLVALVEFVPQVERLVAEQVVLVLLELVQVVVELLLLEQGLLLELVLELAVQPVLVLRRQATGTHLCASR